ncbi:hypothetical protein E2C01_072041 [Portunus trituberculatus]|uniref:Uncharacterized protein n=1 Tax=Portunus trituberculatus TaxID=210409 RepID=A0A5B7IA21_PORTR|nr:hypothetical protein [Portunus trituberculatus]
MQDASVLIQPSQAHAVAVHLVKDVIIHLRFLCFLCSMMRSAPMAVEFPPIGQLRNSLARSLKLCLALGLKSSWAKECISKPIT